MTAAEENKAILEIPSWELNQRLIACLKDGEYRNYVDSRSPRHVFDFVLYEIMQRGPRVVNAYMGRLIDISESVSMEAGSYIPSSYMALFKLLSAPIVVKVAAAVLTLEQE